MPLIEAVLVQTYAGQQCINRFTYLATGTPAAVSFSFALLSAMGGIFDLVAVPPAYPAGTLIKTLAALQDGDVQFNTLSAKNLYSVTDFYENPFVPTLNGAIVGEGASPALAFGFRSNRVRTDVARGMKRFVGVPESFMGQGGTMPTGAGGNIDTLRIKLTEVLSYDDSGNTLTFTPSVLGKEKYEVEVGGIPTGRFAYRYFPTEAEQLDHTAVGVAWQAYDTVRTQVSRQYGRGS